jgi:hypothetical protein
MWTVAIWHADVQGSAVARAGPVGHQASQDRPIECETRCQVRRRDARDLEAIGSLFVTTSVIGRVGTVRQNDADIVAGRTVAMANRNGSRSLAVVLKTTWLAPRATVGIGPTGPCTPCDPCGPVEPVLP